MIEGQEDGTGDRVVGDMRQGGPEEGGGRDGGGNKGTTRQDGAPGIEDR